MSVVLSFHKFVCQMANTRRKKTCYSNNSQKKNCTGKFFSFHRNRTYKAKIEKDFILYFLSNWQKLLVFEMIQRHMEWDCVSKNVSDKYLQVTVFMFEV